MEKNNDREMERYLGYAVVVFYGQPHRLLYFAPPIPNARFTLFICFVFCFLTKIVRKNIRIFGLSAPRLAHRGEPGKERNGQRERKIEIETGTDGNRE